MALPTTINLDDIFHEYKATFDGDSTIRFYVDGVLVGTTQGGSTSRIPNTDDDVFGTFYIKTGTTVARTLIARYFYFTQQNT